MESEEALSVGVLWIIRTGLGQDGGQQLEEQKPEEEGEERRGKRRSLSYE